MEALVSPDPAFWAGKRVFLTGQTGFKGAWLWQWLLRLGAHPAGWALDPETSPNLWSETDGDEAGRGDLRDAEGLRAAMREAAPDIVLHLAAQALVLRSYRDPAGTVASNVLGTMNLLEAVRQAPSVRALLCVTTDKVYLDRGHAHSYREEDPLGGRDPYSASKACAEILAAAWRHSFLDEAGVAVATARAGNVIGGGDWSADRLVPDCLAAFGRGETVSIRHPAATRPWQHVLEPLCGYLLLAESLHRAATGEGPAVQGAWNFGPDPREARPVSWIADRIAASWGEGAQWRRRDGAGPRETGFLAVDAAKARRHLGWQPRLSLEQALDWTVTWHRRHAAGVPAVDLIREQIAVYEALPAAPFAAMPEAAE